MGIGRRHSRRPIPIFPFYNESAPRNGMHSMASSGLTSRSAKVIILTSFQAKFGRALTS
jgi:hypothetical protein